MLAKPRVLTKKCWDICWKCNTFVPETYNGLCGVCVGLFNRCDRCKAMHRRKSHYCAKCETQIRQILAKDMNDYKPSVQKELSKSLYGLGRDRKLGKNRI